MTETDWVGGDPGAEWDGISGPQRAGTASQSEAAEFLGVTTRTLRRWEEDGDGPPRVPKGRARYPWVQLREWAAGPAGLAHGVSTDAPG